MRTRTAAARTGDSKTEQMNSDNSSSARLAVGRGWYERIPVELHGHRKKVDFFLSALERFRTDRGVSRDAVSILEIGCSNGQNVSLPLAERGFEVTGVDLHAPSIEWANAHNEFSNAQFICEDAAIFATERFFDVIVLSDILEHVTDPLHLLRLAHRLLKEEGMVLICIPNGFGPAEIERKLIEATGMNRLLKAIRNGVNRMRRRIPAAYNEGSGHVQYFRMGRIESLIRNAGFILQERQKGALFGGDLTYPLGMLSPMLVRASLAWASRLPFWLVSTWYFRLSRAAAPKQLPEAGRL